MPHTERFDRVEEQAGRIVGELQSLAGEVQHLDPLGIEGLDALLGRVRGVARSLESAAAQAEELANSLEERVSGWWRTNRFTEEGRTVTLARLAELAERRPERARARLLDEVADALQALEGDHAVQLLDGTAAWSRIPRSVAEDLRASGTGDLALESAAVRQLQDLAGELRGGRSSTATRALGILRAWLVQADGDPQHALAVLDELVARAPGDAQLLVERAGLRLAAGDPALAAEDAHRAIELDKADPRPYIQAGAVAEAAGDMPEAVELYLEGSQLLPSGGELVAAPEWASFLKPTGLFHLTRARQLRDGGQLDAALAAVDRAVSHGVAGTTTYPDAEAHDLRRHLLQGLGADDDVITDAAYEAGKRHLWNGDSARAAEALQVATRAGARLPDAGWYLAQSLTPTYMTDLAALLEAQRVWDEWADLVGPPARESAWAYSDRARLNESIDSLQGIDSAPSAWRGVLLCEKGLALDAQVAELWATLSRNLRVLTLGGLAFEAVEAGYQANPDSAYLLEERLALLADAGQVTEALETWDRLPDAGTDPWQSGVKAYLLQGLGQPQEALTYLELPLSGTWDLGWYRELRAKCLVDLGRLDDALADMRALLDDESPWSGPGHYRRAVVRSVLGDLPEARQELAQAQADQSLDAQSKVLAGGLVALGEGELSKAGQLFEEAIRISTDRLSLAAVPRDVERVLMLRRHLGRPVTGGDELVARLARIALSQQPKPADAEEDVQSALRASAEAGPGSLVDVALTALRARRLLGSGEAERAAQLYDRLVGTPFDPESGQALERALEAMYRTAVDHGDVPLVREVYSRMAALGRAPQPFVETAIAEALWGGGRYAEAAGVLSDLADEVVDSARRMQVLGLLGECALFAGVPSQAERALSEASELAARAEEEAYVAQLAVRLAVAATMDRRPEAVVENLSRAVRAWSLAGVWDSNAVLRQELGWILGALPPGTLDGEAREALRELAERLAGNVKGDAIGS